MLKKNSLFTRLVVGKTLSLLLALIGVYLLCYIIPDTTLWFEATIVAWYVTTGAMIALFGVMDKNPVFGFDMPWWFRGAFLGAWMGFILTLAMYDQLAAIFAVETDFQWLNQLNNPFWVVLDAMIFGMIIDWACTYFGGEGKKIVK